MATTTRKTNKSGRAFYEIRVHVSRDRPTLTKRWYPPEGWGQRAIDRELAKVAAEFERKIAGGEVLSREERKSQAAAEAAEAAKIQTFRQYGEQVFMPTKRINCAEKTRSYYQGALDNHLYPALGSFRLPEITSAQISAYFLQLKESGLAHSTIIGIYVTCNQLFKQAYMDETISKNPMDRVQRPRQRKEEQKQMVDAFTFEEVKQIIACLEKEPCFVPALGALASLAVRRGNYSEAHKLAERALAVDAYDSSCANTRLNRSQQRPGERTGLKKTISPSRLTRSWSRSMCSRSAAIITSCTRTLQTVTCKSSARNTA